MKKYRSFTAGVVATLMAVSTVGTALAASSRVEYNKAGISLFGENKVLTGESYKAPNGQDVPSVINRLASCLSTHLSKTMSKFLLYNTSPLR